MTALKPYLHAGPEIRIYECADSITDDVPIRHSACPTVPRGVSILTSSLAPKAFL